MTATIEDKRSLSRDAQRAFLSMVTSAEHELGRATQRLRESLGASPSSADSEDGPDKRTMAQLFVERARQQRAELEQRIESEVHATLSRVRAPIDRELAAMRGRMEQLGEKLDALRTRRRGT